MAKGQWFIFSAVIASAAFLAISMMYRGYFAVDTTKVTRISEDFFFENTLRELNRTVSYSHNNAELSENFKDFSVYVSQKAMSYGCSVNITNIDPLSIAGTTYKITLSSANMNISKFVRYP